MKLAVRLAVPALAVAALAGCSPSPSTVAVVDGVTITRSQVDEATKACQEFQPQVQQNMVIQLLTLRQMGLKGLEKQGIAFDDTELKTAAAQSPEVKQTLETKCWPVIEGNYMVNNLPTRLTPEQVEVIANVPVELNPRYGTFDAVQGWNNAGGSLSVLSEK